MKNLETFKFWQICEWMKLYSLVDRRGVAQIFLKHLNFDVIMNEKVRLTWDCWDSWILKNLNWRGMIEIWNNLSKEIFYVFSPKNFHRFNRLHFIDRLHVRIMYLKWQIFVLLNIYRNKLTCSHIQIDVFI